MARPGSAGACQCGQTIRAGSILQLGKMPRVVGFCKCRSGCWILQAATRRDYQNMDSRACSPFANSNNSFIPYRNNSEKTLWRKHSIDTCNMQEVLMVITPVPRRPSQLPLLARPQKAPHWRDLSSDAQRMIVRLLAQLLRQHRATIAAAEVAKEAQSE